MNSFISLAKQMGIIEKTYYDLLPNSTQCKTFDEVYKSHLEANSKVIVEVKDIYGMLLLLSFGVGLALTTLSVEIVRMLFLYLYLYETSMTYTLQIMKKGMAKLNMMKRRLRDKSITEAWK